MLEPESTSVPVLVNGDDRMHIVTSLVKCRYYVCLGLCLESIRWAVHTHTHTNKNTNTPHTHTNTHTY